MKYILSVVMAGLFVCSPLMAQERVEKVPTYREHALSQNTINDLEATEWSRYVYRVIDNSVDVNSPLFHPVESNDTQTNLFSLIFNLLKEDKIKASRFDLQNVDAKESITLKDVLDLYNIPYTETGRVLSVNRYDIPSDEVVSYYIKERWFFDSKTGTGGVQIAAICPVIHRVQDLETKDAPVLKSPLFWIALDDLRPYLLRSQVSFNSIGDLTKTRNSSLYDYIARRNYKGEIYQVGNRNLYQFFTTPEDLVAEQVRLEKQLEEASTRFKKFQ